jgi:hypothetical protein
VLDGGGGAIITPAAPSAIAALDSDTIGSKAGAEAPTITGTRPSTRFRKRCITASDFVLAELLRLAHDAQDGQAVDAERQVEVGQRVDALEVDRAAVGEGGGGDHEDAAGVGVDRRCHRWAALVAARVGEHTEGSWIAIAPGQWREP